MSKALCFCAQRETVIFAVRAQVRHVRIHLSESIKLFTRALYKAVHASTVCRIQFGIDITKLR